MAKTDRRIRKLEVEKMNDLIRLRRYWSLYRKIVQKKQWQHERMIFWLLAGYANDLSLIELLVASGGITTYG